jgi:hypothetical protein
MLYHKDSDCQTRASFHTPLPTRRPQKKEGYFQTSPAPSALSQHVTLSPPAGIMAWL